MYNYEAMVMEVVDGNTVKLMVDLGFYTIIVQDFKLYGIVPFRKNSVKSKSAKAWLEERLAVGDTVMIDSFYLDGEYYADISYKDVLENLTDAMLMDDALEACPF